MLIILSVLACTSTKRRFWTLTRSGQWFEIVETAFTEKEYGMTTSAFRFQRSSTLLERFRTKLFDQRREGSSEKSWFGTANRLHCTPYPSWARFSGSRTNFIRARTTSRHGPSTGESLVQHG